MVIHLILIIRLKRTHLLNLRKENKYVNDNVNKNTKPDINKLEQELEKCKKRIEDLKKENSELRRMVRTSSISPVSHPDNSQYWKSTQPITISDFSAKTPKIDKASK